MARGLLPALIVLLGPAGCGDGPAAPSALSTTGPTASCPGSATYDVTFSAIWTATSHGNSPPFPSGAHFSRVAGTTHIGPLSLWRRGGIATQGIEDMAETGSVTALCAEVQAEAGAARAGDCIRGQEASFPSPGRVTLSFDVAEDRPFLTLVSMIAPSPDWFVGVDGVALRQDGCWRRSIAMDLVGYDAGTDSGTTFTARDADVTPHEPIGPIDALPAAAREVPFATLVVALRDG